MITFDKPMPRWARYAAAAVLIVAGLFAAYATVALAYPELFSKQEPCCCPEC